MIVTLNVHYSRVANLESPDHLRTVPPVPIESYRDAFGNWCCRLVAPAGRFMLGTDGVIHDSGHADFVDRGAVQHQVQDLPSDTLVFLLPSRYCETDRLSDEAWRLFGGSPLGWPRVQAVCDFVHQHVTFGYEHSRATRTAAETYAERRGVCRDYAHLAITLCRCLNIPARYCTGYISDINLPPSASPMDFGAWMEAYLAFVLNDSAEDALSLPAGAYELPLIVRDASLDSSGNLQYTAKSSGFLGNVPLVNGTRDPKLAVDSTLYRFRVLNGANARVFRFALSNGAQFTVIGNDGGLLETAARVSEIEVGPGERLDLLVDFTGLPVGTSVMLRCLNASWNLLELVVSGTGSSGSSVPTGTLSSITKLSAPVATRVFSFDGMSRINGKVYDMNRIDFRVPFGQTELWRFKTGGNAPHPVHVHGASFQVVSRSGGRATLFPWERGWKDTVLLQDGETVDVLIRFDGFRGLYVMHCHKLEHEDMGMMANFEVY